jgi:NDP-sugar pyrophosphorylase family protein
MKAGIIAAGLGERLRRGGIPGPKPLVRVAGTTLIEHALASVRAAGVHEVACIINEQSAAVEAHCRAHVGDMTLTFVRRTTPSSMESLFALAPHLTADPAPFLLLTVDAIVSPAAMGEFVVAAARRDADAVLAVNTFVDDEKPLHVARRPDGRVAALGPAAATSTFVSAGFYVFRPTIFREVDTARAAGLSALRQFLGHLLASGYALYAEPVPKCVDVDRPEDVATADAFVRSGYSA